MNFTQGITVEEFKKDFYRKTQDLSLYNCGDFNILKVVLDGLKVNYVSKGNIRTTLFYPDALWNLWHFIQLKRNKPRKPSFNSATKVLLADLSSRSEVKSEKIPLSFYFQEFIDNTDPEQILHVVENLKEKIYPHDIDFRKYHSLQYLPLSSEEKKIRKDLLVTYKKLEKSRKFDSSELANIKIAIHLFFTQFKIWNELLGQFPNLSEALLEQHYHHEGLLLALRKRGIRSTELQHGLIAPSDIFYVFPKAVETVRSRALFPDRIFVYGDYWKSILRKGCEFVEDKIIVMGDFRKKNEDAGSDEAMKVIEEFVSNSKIILVSGQTFISDFFSGYVKTLSNLISSRHPEWKIIMKPHPNEKLEDYSGVSSLDNVLVTRTNIHYLFRKAHIHISIYSTTLYDSLEYGLTNFSLDHEKFRDYTRDILADHIALPLSLDQDPIEKYLTNKQNRILVDPSKVYSAFDVNLYKKTILN